MQKLTEMIDGLVAEKTFSLEGVKAIEALRVRAEQIQRDLDEAAAQRKSVTLERDAALKLAQQNAEISQQWKTREDAIAKRELAMTELEKQAAVSAAKAETVKECFGLVFRNAVVSEMSLKSVPVPVPGGPGTSGYVGQGNENETRTQTRT